MLQFLKKTGRRQSVAGNGDTGSTTITLVGQDLNAQSGQKKSDDVIDDVRSPENDAEALCLAERKCFKQRDDRVGVSKLSRRMADILAEQSCMCFFVQYMESKKGLALVKFWLDIESFKAAAFETDRSKTKATSVGYHIPTRLQRSVSSDGYDTISYLSADCDSLSTNSFSENTFDDAYSTDDVREIDSRTPHTYPSMPAMALQVMQEVGNRETTCSVRCDRQQLVVQEKLRKKLEVCDTVIMRQSLTDDEKKQMCEAGKEIAGESSSSVAPSASDVFNSLINSDAVRIYKKYLITNSIHYVDVPATILSTISLTLCSGACSGIIFNELQQYLLQQLEQNYLNPFLESSFYCKYTLEVLTSENLTLIDILGSEMALFYFMEYLEQQKKQHYLEFYVAAVNFKRSFENKAQAQKDAVVLYEKYFSLQATSSLGLSDNVRFMLEEHICSADPTNIAVCFELPSQIIERFLEQRYFSGFINSTLYSRFINEMLGKVEPNSTVCHSRFLESNRSDFESKEMIERKGHRKTLSDVSSDSSIGGKRGNTRTSISSKNTLLAMSDTNLQRNRKHLVTTALAGSMNMPEYGTGMSGSISTIDIMQIDSRQLNNPDLLWRRNSAAIGLSFGRVDALGRYERDFDIAGPPLSDDRWNRNKIKKAVRKLVNLPEDKAQEELAWQVAEMIVKDITSVTMNKTT